MDDDLGLIESSGLFDPVWYARTYGSELLPGESPLAHYIRRGERENAWPSPHFDPEWYRDEYGVGETESPLRHYLLNRSQGTFNPLPEFDVAPETPGSADLTWDAVLELVGGNAADGTVPESVSGVALMQALRLFIPLIPFDESWYCATYPDIAAALRNGEISSARDHFIEHGFFEGRSPVPAQ